MRDATPFARRGTHNSSIYVAHLTAVSSTIQTKWMNLVCGVKMPSVCDGTQPFHLRHFTLCGVPIPQFISVQTISYTYYSRVTHICIYPKKLYLSRLTLCPVRFHLLHGKRKYGYSNCVHWNHENNLLLKIIILFKASILWWTTTIVIFNLSLVLIYR